MPRSSKNACTFLESLQRFDLALLLKDCEIEAAEVEIDDGWLKQLVWEVVVSAPAPVDEALKHLPPHDRKRISEAVVSDVTTASAPDDITIRTAVSGAASNAAVLLAELIVQRETMISVSTGELRIQDVDDYYRARNVRIRERLTGDVPYQNPHADLWDWYNHWKGELPQYKDRRNYIRGMFGPAIEAVSRRPTLPFEEREPTGWERVDRALAKARQQFSTAEAEEDFQSIGLLCREVLISLAQAVYDPSIHQTLDGVAPSSTDANRMLDAFVAHAMPGASHKEVRQHARASLALALNLQHRRTAARQLAALCLEATASTAAVVTIIAKGGPLPDE